MQGSEGLYARRSLHDNHSTQKSKDRHRAEWSQFRDHQTRDSEEEAKENRRLIAPNPGTGSNPGIVEDNLKGSK
jgi:hypothetical protein